MERATGWRGHAAALGVFLVLGWAALLPGSLHPGRALLGYPGDNFQHAWFLWHFARAVGQGQNPFYTNLIYYPNRVNLAWSTSDPLAAAMALPWSWAAGPVAAYNAALALQLALGGFFAYVLCRRVTGNGIAAAVGGACFGFSPFLMGEALGHLSLATAFPIPLYFLALDSALRKEEARWRSGVWLGAALFLTAMAHYNYTVFCVLLTAAVAACDAATEGARRVARAWQAFAAAGATFAALFAPLFWMMWANAADRPRARGFELIEGHSADALGWVVPSWHHLFFGAWAQRQNAGLFTAGYEGITYLGPVIVALAAAGFWSGRRTNRKWAMRGLAAGLGFAVLALGPRLRVWGRQTKVPGPAALFYATPFAKYVSAPARFQVMAMLCFAVLAAMGAAWAIGRFRTSAARAAVALAICAALGLDLLTAPFPSATAAASAEYKGFGVTIEGCRLAADATGTTVATVPEITWPYPVRAMWMQMEDGGRYALADGYVSYGADKLWERFWSVAVLRSLQSVQAGGTADAATDGAGLDAAAREMNLGAIVVFDFPGRERAVEYLKQATGREPQRQPGCAVFDLNGLGGPGERENLY